jgi:hypothetical protein
MRILVTAILLFSILLSVAGCGESVQPMSNVGQSNSVSYTWVKGVSPISDERTGVLRKFGLSAKNYEFTDTGVYYIDPYGFLVYADHGSDDFVILCNRPDCLHADQPVPDWENCNANFYGNSICYDNGFLYVFSGEGLQRCDIDGTNHEIVFSLEDWFGAYEGCSAWSMWNGYLIFYIKHIDPSSGNVMSSGYYYKLDGSMEKPVPGSPPLAFYNSGETFIGTIYEGDDIIYVKWDPATDSTSVLVKDISSVVGSGHYGPEFAIITQGSKVCSYTYADNSVTTLFDTGLEGDLYMHCFSDCFTINQKHNSEYTLHFYNWAYEHLGSVRLDYEKGKIQDFPIAHICGETHERIILAAYKYGMPKYYIDKSEFGTGNINIYEYKLPNLPDY